MMEDYFMTSYSVKHTIKPMIVFFNKNLSYSFDGLFVNSITYFAWKFNYIFIKPT